MAARKAGALALSQGGQMLIRMINKHYRIRQPSAVAPSTAAAALPPCNTRSASLKWSRHLLELIGVRSRLKTGEVVSSLSAFIGVRSRFQVGAGLGMAYGRTLFPRRVPIKAACPLRLCKLCGLKPKVR